jgi:hypothetical protein
MVTMTDETWNGGSDTWASTNWTGGVPNGVQDDATIALPGTYEVSIDAGQDYTVDSLLLDASGVTLDIASTLNLGGVDATALLDEGTIILSGVLEGGTIDIGPTATLAVAGGTITGKVNLEAGGTLDLSGGRLSIGSAGTLDGVVTEGTLTIGGAYDETGLEIGRDVTEIIQGTLIQNTIVEPTNSDHTGATISIASGALYEIDGAFSAAYASTFENSGTLALQNTGQDLLDSADLIETSGASLAIAANSVLDLGGANNVLAGDVSGAGSIVFGPTGIVTLAPDTSLSVSDISIANELVIESQESFGGTFDAPTGIDLNSHNLTLSGSGSLGYNYFLGGGTVSILGTVTGAGTEILTDGVVLNIGGLVVNDAPNFLITNNYSVVDGSLVIAQTGTLIQEADTSFDAANIGTASVLNNGLFVGESNGAVADVVLTFKNEGTIDVESGPFIFSNLTNDHLVSVGSGAVFEASGALVGNGLIELAGDATAAFAGSVASTQTIELSGAGNVVNILEPASMAADILGFTSGDTIDVDVRAEGFTYANNLLTLTSSSGPEPGATLGVMSIASPGGLNFALIHESNGSTAIVDSTVPCYVAGTLIETATGCLPVEDIRVGDLVRTVGPGSADTRPVRWVGRRTIDITRHPRPDDVRPIRIAAGAFGDGLPRRDLRVSPHHAIMVGDYLFEAWSLVNGATVVQETRTREVTYCHIELDSHDIVLAEGLPAESFLNRGHRHMFSERSDDATVTALHPDFTSEGDEGFCLPVIRSGGPLADLRRDLIDRAVLAGFSLSEDIEFDIHVNGRRLRPVAARGTRVYALPPNAEYVEIRSASALAFETSTGTIVDARRLGVALASVSLSMGQLTSAVDLEDQVHHGLYPAADGAVWTNGCARIYLKRLVGAGLLKVTAVAAVPRFRAPPTAYSTTARRLS